MIIFVGIISIHSVVKFGAPLKCVSSVAFAFIWFGCARWNNCAIELNPSTFRLICNASSARQQWVYLWTKTQQQTIRQAYIQQYHRSVPHLLLLLLAKKKCGFPGDGATTISRWLLLVENIFSLLEDKLCASFDAYFRIVWTRKHTFDTPKFGERVKESAFS